MKVGIDLVSVKRFIDKIDDNRLLAHLFTKEESAHIAEMNSPQARAERIAGKFAAKEAVVKAFGTGISSVISWLDITILPDELGKPVVTLSKKAQELMKNLKIKEIDVSISHTESDAVAICVAN